MKHDNLPLISCLCITKNKPQHLNRAIDCFLHQTYPNKELIIVFEDNDPATAEMMHKNEHENIRYFEVPFVPKLTMGRLRNFSIEKANGEYFCQWDDDDWYHISRLELQFNAVKKSHKPSSFLAYWLIYDMVNDHSFFSPVGPWPGTVLCKKDITGNRISYPDQIFHEDSAFMLNLIEYNAAVPIIVPNLYIYAYHGNNSFNWEHFEYMFRLSQRLPDHVTALFKKIFDGDISATQASRLLSEKDILEPIHYFWDKVKQINASHEV
jgi:glycosyltransferase involved in cell wall biosynthesis